jgi:hypothetical protein
MPAERPSAIRYYAEDHPALAHTLAAKIGKEIASLSDQVASGFASDYPDYRERIGVIRGLKQAIGICNEAEKELNR